MLTMDLPEFLNDLEAAILRFLLHEDTADNRAILEQIRSGSLESREHNGYGIYTNFHVADKAPRCSTMDFELSDVSALISGQLCGFILFVRAGRVAFLEGFLLGGDSWPSSENVEKIGRFLNVDSID